VGGVPGEKRAFEKPILYTGDAVFALGALRFGLPPLSGVGQARCQLVRSSGVLLVSGASEREAKVEVAPLVRTPK
jgi:glyoxylase-like metal-dependent hydrolase (beta-lactamase superfamily II)